MFRYRIIKEASKLVPVRTWRRQIRRYIKYNQPVLAYSQEGEDMILNRYYGNKKNGFYVDIGAHHPFRFSNTALFSRRGWAGINIDPLPGSKKRFDRHRPRDINLEIGIAADRGELEYFMFNDPALNTFDVSTAKSHNDTGFYIIGKKSIPILPLREVLEANLPVGQDIDLLTIDSEGLDFQVLQSNDWEKFRPEIVVVEMLSSEKMKDKIETESSVFLKKQGYEMIASTMNSVFFKRYKDL